jgi:hypothetical protein
VKERDRERKRERERGGGRGGGESENINVTIIESITVLIGNKNGKIINMDNKMKRELGRDNSFPIERITKNNCQIDIIGLSGLVLHLSSCYSDRRLSGFSQSFQANAIML